MNTCGVNEPWVKASKTLPLNCLVYATPALYRGKYRTLLKYISTEIYPVSAGISLWVPKLKLLKALPALLLT